MRAGGIARKHPFMNTVRPKQTYSFLCSDKTMGKDKADEELQGIPRNKCIKGTQKRLPVRGARRKGAPQNEGVDVGQLYEKSGRGRAIPAREKLCPSSR